MYQSTVTHIQIVQPSYTLWLFVMLLFLLRLFFLLEDYANCHYLILCHLHNSHPTLTVLTIPYSFHSVVYMLYNLTLPYVR